MPSLLAVFLSACIGPLSSGDSGTVDCSGYEGLATPEEIASTPRDNDQLEGLAIALDDSFVASSGTYERLRADLTAARGSYPEVTDIQTSYEFYGRFIYVMNLDATTLDEIAAGTDSRVHCADALYERVDSTRSPNDFVELEFKGVYNHTALAQEYERLIGGRVDPRADEGDGDHICVVRDGDTWQYRLEDGFGDCPAGCVSHHFYHLVSKAAGAPVLLDDWGDVDLGGGKVGTDPDPEPDWMGLDWTCFSQS